MLIYLESRSLWDHTWHLKIDISHKFQHNIRARHLGTDVVSKTCRRTFSLPGENVRQRTVCVCVYMCVWVGG